MDGAQLAALAFLPDHEKRGNLRRAQVRHGGTSWWLGQRR